MQKIRTVNQVLAFIKEQDPDTAINEKALRRAINNGSIPCVKSGKRILLNIDRVLEYYGCDT